MLEDFSMTCRRSCSREASSHSTRNNDSSARQKSANATFQALPPCASWCPRFLRARMTTGSSALGRTLLSCTRVSGASLQVRTIRGAALRCLFFRSLALELVDPALELREARLDVELDQAAAGVDREQRRLAGHLRDEHDLDGLECLALLID